MNRYGPRRKGLPASQVLTHNDLLFCIEYAKNGQNGTKAYMTVHSKAKDQTARAEAVRVLAKPSVTQQLNRMYRAAIPDTIETIKQELDLAQELARESKDPSVIASIAMDRAKLAGLLIDRKEVRTIADEDIAAVKQAVIISIQNGCTTPQP